MSDSATPWTIACQAPLSIEFSRQEYWNGLPFHSPGGCPNPGTEPRSPELLADSLPSELPLSVCVSHSFMSDSLGPHGLQVSISSFLSPNLMAFLVYIFISLLYHLPLDYPFLDMSSPGLNNLLFCLANHSCSSLQTLSSSVLSSFHHLCFLDF